MMKVRVDSDSIRIGKHVQISFQRTLRIPDDGRTYPLPPGLGEFPVRRVEDYADRVPESWREHGGVFIPMYQREALWLNFDGAYWRPNALKVAVGKVNAITGEAWDEELSAKPQDYLVVPDQPWLDGINAGDGFIRQFVAMPLGMGYTVEGQVTGEEEFGGIQIVAFDPKPGRFPDQPDHGRVLSNACYEKGMLCSPSPDMGLAAGGRMEQEIYEDEYGLDTWDTENRRRVYIHIVNSMDYRNITGEEPPATPISASLYTEYGLPWFDLYDESKTGIAGSDVLAKVKSTKEVDTEKGFGPQQDDTPVDVPKGQVVELGDKTAVHDGKW